MDLNRSDPDPGFLQRALELAVRGRGLVEPNPMVGCVIVRDGQVVGEGWHRRFGEPHAEIEAIRAAGEAAAGATLYVSLEPCCHHGKTPPCSEAVIAAGIRRVVVAQRDPFPAVNGGGLQQLERAGIEVRLGVMESEARCLNAPYLKLVQTGRPWTIAKWALTLDGKLATRTGDSRWISSPESRANVHSLRGRVDAILVGRGTVVADNPLLTARPPGPRTATRIVLDSLATLPLDSQLVRTVAEAPVLVACGPAAPRENRDRLTDAGCELLVLTGTTPDERREQLFAELGRRRMTNVLVEGGGQVLGALIDAQAIDEVHVYVAPKLVGGSDAKAIGGRGAPAMAGCLTLDPCHVETVGPDLYLWGHVLRR